MPGLYPSTAAAPETSSSKRDWVRATMADLHAAGVQLLTLGQYLRPSPRHQPVARYVPPDEFRALAADGAVLGFHHVEAGPLVRSSYHAKRQTEAAAAGVTSERT